MTNTSSSPDTSAELLPSLKEQVQDAIIAALVNAAFTKDDAGFPEVAHAIRLEAAKMAKRWGISEVSGLPATWKTGKRVPSYD